MSLFTPAGLAISLPGAEVAALDLPGSVTEADAVLACSTLSLELRAALLLVLEACRHQHVPVRIVARPEIFTHGASERWLRERLGNITQHLCISDGTTIKPIPGCRTHAFFYNLGRYENFLAQQRLSIRAPEIVACVESQVNTALSLGNGGYRFVPKPLYLSQTMTIPRPPARLMPFLFNKYSAAETAHRVEQRGEVLAEHVPKCDETIYMLLTERALHDDHFARAVAESILRAFFRPNTLLVIRLPPTEGSPRSLTAQIRAILPQLNKTGVTFPHSCPPNVLLATEDLPEDAVILAARPWTMMFHESFDFWRYSEAFYRQAKRVSVMANPDDSSPLNVELLFGPRACRVWLPKRDIALT